MVDFIDGISRELAQPYEVLKNELLYENGCPFEDMYEKQRKFKDLNPEHHQSYRRYTEAYKKEKVAADIKHLVHG